MIELTEEQFAAHLIEVGWSEEEAKAHAAEVYRGDAGDVDGDME